MQVRVRALKDFSYLRETPDGMKTAKAFKGFAHFVDAEFLDGWTKNGLVEDISSLKIQQLPVVSGDFHDEGGECWIEWPDGLNTIRSEKFKRVSSCREIAGWMTVYFGCDPDFAIEYSMMLFFTSAFGEGYKLAEESARKVRNAARGVFND